MLGRRLQPTRSPASPGPEAVAYVPAPDLEVLAGPGGWGEAQACARSRAGTRRARLWPGRATRPSVLRRGRETVRLEWRRTGTGADYVEARLPKPAAPPPGYTGNTVVTEWLLLHCRGDWSSRSAHGSLVVRFRNSEDMDRALARFGGTRVRRQSGDGGGD